MTGINDWAPYLDPDEKVLWTGRPPQGFLLDRSDLVDIPFSLVWGGIAVPGGGAVMVHGIVEPSLWSTITVPISGFFFFMGLYILVGRFFVDRWIRRNTRYAITNRRAYIATRSFRRRELMTMALIPATPVTLTLGRRASVKIGVENEAASEEGFSQWSRHKRGEFVLEGLQDGQATYQLIRRVQRGDS
ncbi:MAG: hypothetical protein AAF409_01700 [Pseudomonadota bacterium]